jgi:hypothetical protein
MWALLSDPGFVVGFGYLGDAYAPMCRLLAELAEREYACRVYGVKSMASFSITTAPTYQEQDGHDYVGILYNPTHRMFVVDYSEWVSTPHYSSRVVASRMCEGEEVAEVIDRYVLRLFLTARSA